LHQGGNERKPSLVTQSQKAADDNVRYEVINFEIQESENLPRARIFTGKVEEEEYENSVPPELAKKRASSKRIGAEQERKQERDALEDL